MMQDFFTSIADRIREKYNIEDTLTREEIIEKLNTWEVSPKKTTKELLNTLLENNSIKIFINKEAKSINGLIANESLIRLIVPRAEKIILASDYYNYQTYRRMKNLIKLDCCFNSNSLSEMHELTKLVILILRNTTVPNLTSSDWIPNKIRTTGYIYVPKALIEDYKIATNWSVYADRFRAIENYPEITGGALE